jgi:hypothetical protein
MKALTYDFSPRIEPRSNHNSRNLPTKKWKQKCKFHKQFIAHINERIPMAKPIIGDHGKCIMFGGKIYLKICT